MTAAAVEAFREFTCPCMGMLTRKSQFSVTRRPMPSPSEPMTRHTAPLRSVLQSELSASAAVP